MDMDPAKILASVLFFRVLGFTSCSSSYLTLSRSTFVDTFIKNQLTFPPPPFLWLTAISSGQAAVSTSSEGKGKLRFARAAPSPLVTSLLGWGFPCRALVARHVVVVYT